MKWQKQYSLRDELNAHYPPMRSNIGQQMFRSNYYKLPMGGQNVADAARTAAQIVRIYVPGFTPIQT